MRLVPLEMLYSHSDSTLATLVYTKPNAFGFIADTRRPALLPAAPRRPSKGVGAELPAAELMCTEPLRIWHPTAGLFTPCDGRCECHNLLSYRR